MQLADYMREEALDDAAFAALIGPGFSPWTVRKWRYGQRTPRPEMLRRIAAITGHRVTPNDFADVNQPAVAS